MPPKREEQSSLMLCLYHVSSAMPGLLSLQPTSLVFCSDLPRPTAVRPSISSLSRGPSAAGTHSPRRRAAPECRGRFMSGGAPLFLSSQPRGFVPGSPAGQGGSPGIESPAATTVLQLLSKVHLWEHTSSTDLIHRQACEGRRRWRATPGAAPGW